MRTKILLTILLCAFSYRVSHAQFVFDIDKFAETAVYANEKRTSQSDYSAYIEQSNNVIFTYLSLFKRYGDVSDNSAIESYLDNPYYGYLWEGAKDMLTILDAAYISVGLNRDNYINYLVMDKIRRELQTCLSKSGGEGIYPTNEMLEKKFQEKIKRNYEETYEFSSQFKRVSSRNVSLLIPISECDTLSQGIDAWGTKFYNAYFYKQESNVKSISDWVRGKHKSKDCEVMQKWSPCRNLSVHTKDNCWKQFCGYS